MAARPGRGGAGGTSARPPCSGLPRGRDCRGRPGGVQSSQLIPEAAATVDQPDQTEDTRCNRLSAHCEPQWLHLGGQATPLRTHPPATGPPVTARNALYQFPQCPGVITKTVIEELQNRVENATRFQWTPPGSPAWTVPTDVIDNCRLVIVPRAAAFCQGS